MRSILMICGLIFSGTLMFANLTAEAQSMKFSFGKRAIPSFQTVNSAYSAATGYGFESSAGTPAIHAYDTFCNADQPFSFSVRANEGTYRVTVTLGDPAGESETIIKAESRRLMVEHAKTAGGQAERVSFLVNVRSQNISTGGQVKLADRELPGEIWDDKLTLEFNGARPCVQTVEIEPVADAITVYIAGDSTVCDGGEEPWTGWGQILPNFLSSKVVVANYAESGRALFSFRSERRLDKILSVIKPGDYLFIQFGHNDQKDKRPGAGAFTTYAADLEQYVAVTRAKGAMPVLITPMYRRRFDAAGTLQESLGDFPAAVRKVAAEQHVALIDLHEMSGRFFQSLGVEGTLKAFVHYPANTFPGQKDPLKDDTHFNPYGGYELARCIVEGIRTSDLPLAKELKPGIKPFDPAHPDAVADVAIPASPFKLISKPEGN